MISKLEILKFVTKVHKRGMGIQDRRLSHPQRDWLLGLSFFVLTTGAGAVYSLYSFEVYKTLDEQSYTLESTIPTYNRAAATTVLDFYAGRKNNFDALLGEVATVPVVPENATTASTTAPSQEVEPQEIIDINTQTDPTQSTESAWLES